MKRLRLGLCAVTFGVGAAGCAPSPAKVCDHVVAVTRAGSPDAAAAIDVPACTAQMETERDRLGSAQWGELAKCMLGAASLEAMKACDRPAA